MSHLTHLLKLSLFIFFGIFPRGSFYILRNFRHSPRPRSRSNIPRPPATGSAEKTRNFAGEKIETDLTKSIIYDRISIVKRSKKGQRLPPTKAKKPLPATRSGGKLIIAQPPRKRKGYYYVKDHNEQSPLEYP